MGQNSGKDKYNIDANTCGYLEYPGYSDDEKKPTCMTVGWIVAPGDPYTLNGDKDMEAAYTKVLSLLKSKNCVSMRNTAYWFMRWIYFDRQGGPKDVHARLKFLHKYLGNKSFQTFLDNSTAWTIAENNNGRTVVYMDSTVPGNINFICVCNGEPKSSQVNIDRNWKNRSLQDFAQKILDRKTVKFHNRK